MNVDQLVSAIRAWTAETLPGMELTLCAPGAPPDGEGLFLCFAGYRGANDSRNTLARRDPVVDVLEVELVLTIAAADALEQARLAADFHFAALQGDAPFIVVAPPAAHDLLRAVSAVPGRSIPLRARIARQRDAKPTVPVREARFNLTDRALADDALHEQTNGG